MSTTGGNIGIKRAWPPGFNGWAGDSDMNLLLLDALAQPIVKSVTISTPPGSPAQGDAYIVGGSPTGAWAGKANQIAIWDGVQWQFAVAKNGWRVYNQGDSGKYEFNGSVWVIAYLEGTFVSSLVLGSGSATLSSTNDTLQYTRVGRIVHVQGVLVVSAISSPSGGLSVALPFTAAAGTKGSGYAAGNLFLAGAASSWTGSAVCRVVAGGSAMNIYEFAAGTISDPGAKVQNGMNLYLGMTYEV